MTAARDLFEYAAVQVVPRVDRGECINVGVLLYCQPRRFLAARISLDLTRLRALDPYADVDGIERTLAALSQVCAGGEAAGPAGLEKPGSRFRRLVAPRSTVVRAGSVHTGLTLDPEAEIERLLGLMVLPIE